MIIDKTRLTLLKEKGKGIIKKLPYPYHTFKLHLSSPGRLIQKTCIRDNVSPLFYDLRVDMPRPR